MSFIKDFKEFALKGNVVDMAVGVIIGGAFGKIVTSLVNDIIMPLIGSMGCGDFTTLSVKLRDAQLDANGEVVKEAVMLNYGNFIQTTVDFLIIALCIFFAIKGINSLKRKMEKKQEEAPAAPAAPTKEEELLTEIRDLLKEKK